MAIYIVDTASIPSPQVGDLLVVLPCVTIPVPRTRLATGMYAASTGRNGAQIKWILIVASNGQGQTTVINTKVPVPQVAPQIMQTTQGTMSYALTVPTGYQFGWVTYGGSDLAGTYYPQYTVAGNVLTLTFNPDSGIEMKVYYIPI